MLDQLAPDRPLIVWQRSFHEVIVNSAMLREWGLTDEAAFNAALAARSGAQGMEHLATVWASVAATLEELLLAYEAAEDAVALGAIAERLRALVEAFGAVQGLAAVNDATLR